MSGYETPKTKTCKKCGKEYETLEWGRLCPECKLEYDREYKRDWNRKQKEIQERTLTCPQCGKEFQTAYVKARFCSKECRLKYANTHRVRNYAEKTCLECGKTFAPSRPTQKFCSTSCASIHAHKEREAQELKKKEEIKEEIKKLPTFYRKPCAWCGKEFETKNQSTRFCSPSCGMSFVRAEQRKNAPPKVEVPKPPKPEKPKPEPKIIKLPPVEKKLGLMAVRNPKSQIAQVEAAARDAGLSYGKYVAGYLAENERMRRAIINELRNEQEKREREARRRRDELMKDFENLG